jgi:hypothetical protein
VDCVEGVLPLGADPGCGAVVPRSRGVQSDPGVTVLKVVVAEERLAESAGIGQRPATPANNWAVRVHFEVAVRDRLASVAVGRYAARPGSLSAEHE